jgi:ABC-type dipeptide/oligopeptide/nickel transport system permease subunit
MSTSISYYFKSACTIGGILSLIIGVFDYKSNYTALLVGYAFIAIVIVTILLDLSAYFKFEVDEKVNGALVCMNAFPFIIILISIICLFFILGQHSDQINGLYVSMQYYEKCSNALLTLIVIITIYSSAIVPLIIKNNEKEWPILDVDIPFVLLFFALWFFGYVVVIRDILKYNTTDERNEYYMTLTGENEPEKY